MKIKPTPETIWSRPAYLPYVHPPLTDKDVRNAEKQLGCTLPKEFLDLLCVQNGGPIRFKLPDSVGDMIAGIGPSFPSITDYHLSEDQEYVDFPLTGLVPFDGDGHWYYCLDFRNAPNTPSVCSIDVECNNQRQIAASFSDYLNLLELEIGDELVLTNVEGIEDAKVRLEALFGFKLEAKISNIGVPTLNCQTGKKWDECFWISPNEVAGGYSGDAPDSFEFVGNALLFPELPPNAVIFEAPENYVESYRTRLRDAGYGLVKIHEAVK